MIMTFGKRQLVIASLVVALGAAVYLNWQFSDSENIIAAENESSSAKQLGQTTYVNTELSASEVSKTETSAASEKQTKETSGQTSQTAKKVNAEVDNGHFAAERSKREKSNEKSIESLTDVIEAASADESAKKEAVKTAEKLSTYIKAQTDIENEIKTRGFEDVLVIINNENCIVSVYGGKLDEASAISIKDIVNRQTGINFDKITVSQAEK